MADTVSGHVVPKAVPAAQDLHLREMANCIRLNAVQRAKHWRG